MSNDMRLSQNMVRHEIIKDLISLKPYGIVSCKSSDCEWISAKFDTEELTVYLYDNKNKVSFATIEDDDFKNEWWLDIFGYTAAKNDPARQVIYDSTRR